MPKGVAAPTTREEALRRFVESNEIDPLGEEQVRLVINAMHRRYLEQLACVGIGPANTIISEHKARRAVARCSRALITEDQISQPPQPFDVLEVLVRHHVLTVERDSQAYAFQHHQFQEWFASLYVERLMLDAAQDVASRRRLQGEVFNWRTWEEAILFACERMGTSGEQARRKACGAGIFAAYDVDPMLAAEMIYRATGEVWQLIAEEIQARAVGWHAPGTADRALAFMTASGREEFANFVWPLLTSENKGLRQEVITWRKRFRASVLGEHAADRLVALPDDFRRTIVVEIADYCGIDSIGVAVAAVERDSDSETRVQVAEELA